MSLARRFAMGMISGAGSVVVKNLLNIALFPVLIHILGVELFSLYMLVVSIQEISLLLDLGFTNAIVTMLAGAEGQQDTNKSREILKMGHLIFICLASLVIVVGLTIAPMFPDIFSIDEDLRDISRLAATFVMIETAITLYATYYQGVLLSHYLNQWTNVGETLYVLFGTGLGVGLLIMGYGLEGVLVARLLGAIARDSVILYQAFKIEPLVFWSNAPIRMERFKEMVRLTIHAMMLNISVIVSHKIDAVVIARFLPLVQVGYYEIVFRFLGRIIELCRRLSEGLFPLFSRLKSTDNSTMARQVFLRVSAFNSMLVSIMLVLFVGFYPPLFAFFTAGEMEIGPTWPVLAAAVPIVWSSVMQIPASFYLYTSGKEKFLSISSLITAVSNVTLSILLVKPMGILGVAFGTMVPQFTQHQGSLIVEACREMKIPIWHYYSKVHGPVLCLVALNYGIIQLLTPTLSWGPHPLFVVGIAGILLMVLSAWAWFVWTGTEEEKVFFREKILTKLPVRN
ncbi:MAG: oligosaccharide flippase family protein [Vampirovibrio sp.]|nr:oligosaccharide flippase family protein [Vampirovibrio sp.]